MAANQCKSGRCYLSFRQLPPGSQEMLPAKWVWAAGGAFQLISIRRIGGIKKCAALDPVIVVLFTCSLKN